MRCVNIPSIVISWSTHSSGNDPCNASNSGCNPSDGLDDARDDGHAISSSCGTLHHRKAASGGNASDACLGP